MNTKVRYLISVLIMAILALSVAATVMASTEQFENGQLITPNVLTIAGSRTVGPIATEELTTFPSYWNNLVSTIGQTPNGASWGTAGAIDINSVSLAALGSGTAVPALVQTAGAADLGEMSRPPSTGEYASANMTNLQLWAVGVDSVAIVLSPDMTWFPVSVTTLQAANLFADNSPFTTQSADNGTGAFAPLYNTWGDFMYAYYGVANTGNVANDLPTAVAAGYTTAINNTQINRAVRDPTSGTFDCFNNYFAVPNGYQFEYKTGSPSVCVASQEMPAYTFDEANIDIYNQVSAGTAAAHTDAIGFISLGYYESLGHMIALNIAFNMASPPAGASPATSPLIAYYGPSHTIGAATNSAYSGYSVYQWGPYVVPNDNNVKAAFTGVVNEYATGSYEAWRWLWEVTPSTIPTTGPLLATGVWIAYMRAANTTIDGAATYANGTAIPVGKGSSDFVADSSYIELPKASLTGGQMIDSNLNPYTPIGGQTKQIPNGQCSFSDITYFVSGYIHYYTQSVYNPYCDFNADGQITFGDLTAFVHAYIQYFVSYNPVA